MEGLSPADGAATLAAFTVAALAAGTRFLPAHPAAWIVSGGGARNPLVFEGLRRVLGANTVTADAAGLSASFMEAQAFAYLAVRHVQGLPSTFPGTTGVSEPVDRPDISPGPICATASRSPLCTRHDGRMRAAVDAQ